MTKPDPYTPLFAIWDLSSLYAVSSGLFLPGALMTARMQAIPISVSTSPSPSRARP